MGALGKAVLSPEGIALSPQLLSDLGRVIYCPGYMVNAGTMLCQVLGLPGTWSGFRDLDLGLANPIQGMLEPASRSSSSLGFNPKFFSI
jgi:hypothetical protein